MTEQDTNRTQEKVYEDEREFDASIFEKVMPEGVKDRIKNLVGDMKLPKEIITHILHQVEETKQSALGIVAKETRLFLEKTNLGDELARLLTVLNEKRKGSAGPEPVEAGDQSPGDGE